MILPIRVWKAFIEKQPMEVDEKSMKQMRMLMKMREQGKLSEITCVINRHSVLINLKSDPNSVGQRSMTLQMDKVGYQETMDKVANNFPKL